MNRLYRLTLLGLGIALSACTLGPDFRSPDARLPDAWALQQGPVRSQPEAANVQARWWESFADAQLSSRERDVLRLYAAGLPLKAVAERLGVAYSTAKENITRIRVKYVEVGRPAPTKVDLLRRAVEDGILPGLDNDGDDSA